MVRPDNLMARPRSKYHPKEICKRIKNVIMRYNPFKEEEDLGPPPAHRHTVCSNCNTSVSYDVWGVCPRTPVDGRYQRKETRRAGVCKHCKASDEIARVYCDPLTCEGCWRENGEEAVLKRRDRDLLRRGFVKKKNDMWNWAAPRIGGGKDFAAPWDMVRCGPCEYVDPNWPTRARKEWFKEDFRRRHGAEGPALVA
ncbi:uncharacterized protein RSE6_14450 [Rhynchosporium secalis]|uniref:Uncharacterized protein n=1 Tax=Rhynchosporium secalis TaxID=38038 RepID=A0A1E1MVC3_RHYSE|nr:uncharacterized protein RSE6_14450 [Rhynchosporium secalis]